MRIRSLLLLALPLLLAAAGCEEEPSEPNRATLPIMPLKVGNTWIGQSFALDSLGNNIDLVRDTLSIVSSEVIAGETWYVTNGGMRLANRPDGLWRMRTPDDEPALLAMHPAEVGQIYGRDSLQADSVVVSWLVIGVGRSLSVEGRTYSVNVYQLQVANYLGQVYDDSDPLGSGDQHFYAPGVGPVQRLTYGIFGNGKKIDRTWELLEARLQ